MLFSIPSVASLLLARCRTIWAARPSGAMERPRCTGTTMMFRQASLAAIRKARPSIPDVFSCSWRARASLERRLVPWPARFEPTFNHEDGGFGGATQSAKPAYRFRFNDNWDCEKRYRAWFSPRNAKAERGSSDCVPVERRKAPCRMRQKEGRRSPVMMGMSERLDEPATWFAPPNVVGEQFDLFEQAVARAVSTPPDERHPRAEIVTRSGATYEWDAIEECRASLDRARADALAHAMAAAIGAIAPLPVPRPAPGSGLERGFAQLRRKTAMGNLRFNVCLARRPIEVGCTGTCIDFGRPSSRQ